MYIWPLIGDAISGPTMCTHSGSSKGQWALGPQSGVGFAGADFLILGSHLQLASTLILCALGHHGPGRSYIFVGERNRCSTVSVAIDDIL
jgi:hypothetical protein